MSDPLFWRVDLTDKAEEDLERMDAGTRRRILERLRWLETHFSEVVPLPLGGPWKGFFKLRVGDWRVIYQIEHTDHVITVHHIDRRDKIYKQA